MKLRKLVISALMRLDGDILVGTIKSADGLVYYSFSKITNTYSFWKNSLWGRPRIMESGLTREQARFKKFLLEVQK